MTHCVPFLVSDTLKCPDLLNSNSKELNHYSNQDKTDRMRHFIVL